MIFLGSPPIGFDHILALKIIMGALLAKNSTSEKKLSADTKKHKVGKNSIKKSSEKMEFTILTKEEVEKDRSSAYDYVVKA